MVEKPVYKICRDTFEQMTGIHRKVAEAEIRDGNWVIIDDKTKSK